MIKTIVTFIIYAAVLAAFLFGAYFFWEKYTAIKTKQEEENIAQVAAAESKNVSVERKNYKCTNKKTGDVIYSSNCPASYTTEEIKAVSKMGVTPRNSEISQITSQTSNPAPRPGSGSGSGPDITVIKDIKQEVNLCNIKYNKLIIDTERSKGCLRDRWCKKRVNDFKDEKELCIKAAKNTSSDKNRYL